MSATGTHPLDFVSVVLSKCGTKFYIEVHQQHASLFATLLGASVYHSETCHIDNVVRRLWCHKQNLNDTMSSIVNAPRFTSLAVTINGAPFKCVVIIDQHDMF